MTGRRPARQGPEARAVRVLEDKRGNAVVEDLSVDQVPGLLTAGAGHVSVSASIGFAYQPFAPGKCSVHITLGCDQDTDTMDRAVHIALRMAREYALDGMELIREDVESGRFVLVEE